jgi:hypothetical protein
MTAADAHRAILAVWRIEQPRLITSLARMLRDVPLAEDLTQEALLAALERWPATGVPEKPGAWLMATAKRRRLTHGADTGVPDNHFDLPFCIRHLHTRCGCAAGGSQAMHNWPYLHLKVDG